MTFCAAETELSPCLDSPAVNALRTGFSLLDTVSQATGGGSFSPSSGKGCVSVSRLRQRGGGLLKTACAAFAPSLGLSEGCTAAPRQALVPLFDGRLTALPCPTPAAVPLQI